MSEGSGQTTLKDPERPIAEYATECAQDISSIGKQIVDLVLERDKNRRSTREGLIDLIKLFEDKLEEMRNLILISPQYREREEIIQQLQRCVENRDEVIQRYADNLRGAEQVLTKGIFQANKKLKKIAEADANPVLSEDVIKFAHQISKSYSVAAPHYWQQGDPMRPFPTEAEFRQSSIAAPRSSTSTTSAAASQSAIGAALGSRSPALFGSRVSSPAQYGQSPRTSAYSTTSQSPRGRVGAPGGGTPSGSSAGGQTPWRGQEVSPFGLQRRPDPSPRRPAQAPPAAPAPDQMMSSDSSSSSSSDDDTN